MSPALWTVVGVVGAAGAAVAGWYMYRRQMPPLRVLDARFQWPDLHFRYAPQEIFDGLERLGSQGRARMRRLWLADTGLSVALLAAANNSVADPAPLRMAMDAAACLRTLADLLENALLACAVRGYPERRRTGMVRVAAVVTAGKWCLTGLWVAGLFGGLVLRAARL
ncbi:MAG TPA: hypothetical protein IAC11_09170 [Candidatus Limiplasma pullicola]|nr:hypothetical protein [Candidatus Limiplasma pullicola]